MKNFIDKWKLGILYKDGKVVNHRSVLQVFLNPILGKFFGVVIATNFVNGKYPKGISLIKGQVRKKMKWDPDGHWDFDKIEHKRIWF